MTVTPLIDVADAQAQLNDTTPDDALEISQYILAATEIVNRKCGYSAPTPFVETVWGQADRWTGRWYVALSRIPVLTVSAITPTVLGIPTYDLTRLVVDSESGVIYFSNWWPFYGPMTVSYMAGRSEIPQALQTACALIVQGMWRSQRGGATAVPGAGNDESGAAGEGLPYAALQLMELGPYYGAPTLA